MNKLKSIFLDRAIAFLFLFILLCAFATTAFPNKKDAFFYSYASPSEKYDTVFALGEKARLNGDFTLALEIFNKSFKVAKECGDFEGMYNSLIKEALSLWNIGDFKGSEQKYAQSLTIAILLNDIDKVQYCKNILAIFENYHKGKDRRSSGNYTESIDSFNTAIKLSKKINSKDHELKCLRQLSLNYWYDNNLQLFLSLNKEALLIAKGLRHRQEEGKCLNNIGLFYIRIDNYSEAIKYYEQSLSIAKDLADLEDQANSLNNMGAIFLDLGNYDRALDYFFQALTIDRKLDDDESISKDLNNIGSIFRRKGILTEKKEDFYSALNYYNDSLAIAGKSKDELTEIKALNNIGTVYSHLGENLRSLDYFQAALKKALENQEKEEVSIVFNNIGIVYAQLGNFEESTKYYQKAIDLALDIRGGKILWEAYLELANVYKNQNQYNLALDNYKKSISVIENIRSGLNLEEYRASFFGTDKRIEAYQNIIDLFAKLYNKDQRREYEEKAFYYFERAKARAFLDSIEVSKINLTEGIGQKYLNEEADLMNEISKIHTKLLAPQLTPQQRSGFDNELVRLESQLESLKREIREESPAYANLRYPKTLELAEAQNELTDGETAFFAYMLAKENSYAFVITKDNIKLFPLPDRKEIQDSVQDYLKSITDVENRDFHLGHELYNNLVQPGLNKRIKKLVFIPDDVLYFLPFEALLMEDNSKGWLINKYKISYAPSLSSLRELIERKKTTRLNSKKDILAVGDPLFGDNEIEPTLEAGKGTLSSEFSIAEPKFYRLKYSGVETEKIAALFKSGKKDIFKRAQASEDVLKQQTLADYKIIHFATHAIIDDKKPGRSAIVLTLDQDPKEDGLLQMREVFNLRLNADLVTLSACQTGLGQLIRGEGIEGLSRAFFYAGASSVLLSLWAINDQASYQLLERFYFHLRSSDSITNALRKAKLELIASGVLEHPYYWSGFVVTGDADEIVLPRQMNKWILVTLSLCAGLALFIFIINRDKSPLLGFKY